MFKKAISLSVLSAFLTTAALAQEDNPTPLDPQLYNNDPEDICVNTIGEIFDEKAKEIEVPPLLLRNLYLDIIKDAARESTAPAHEQIHIPDFNEKIENIDPDLALAIGILTRDVTAVSRFFGQDCDLRI